VWYLVGLGNPGNRYRFTRHNLGFLVLDRFASQRQISWKERKRVAMIGRGSTGDHEIVLVKPITFMNNSGQVLSPIVRKSGVTTSSILVIHDDLDLPLGKLKIKRGGGPGGHKGVASIQRELNDADFLRLKMGIGRPEDLEAAEDYVLRSFSKEDAEDLQAFIDQGAEAISCILQEGESQAMNLFNRRDETLPGDGEGQQAEDVK